MNLEFLRPNTAEEKPNHFGIEPLRSSEVGLYVSTPQNVSDIDEIIYRLIDGNTVGDIWINESGVVFYRSNSDVLRVGGINPEQLKPEIMHDWLSRVVGDPSHITHAFDGAYSISRGAVSRRFRVNAYRSLGKLRVCLRLIADSVPEPAKLRIPEQLHQNFCNYSDGLVLICGATGSGKSTTIASMLAARSRLRREHIITLEDPIEYIFKDSLAFFSQREKGSDFAFYPEAVKHSLRESPDTIFIGEIRDKETAEAALQAAETGHLVVSTMHTKRSADALERFMLLFPESDKLRVLSMMASVMRFVLCQKLVPTVHGKRVAAFEPMLVDEASNLQPVIRRGDRLAISLQNTIEQTNYKANYTFSKDLDNLYASGIISKDTYDVYTKSVQ